MKRVPQRSIQKRRTSTKTLEIGGVGSAKRLQSKSPQDIRRTFDSLSIKLGIKRQHDWYAVKSKSIPHNGMFSKKSHADIMGMLSTAYPEFIWYRWLFDSTPWGFWSVAENQRKYLDWVAEELNIETQEEWYYVGYQQLFELNSTSLLKMYNQSVLSALESVYSEFLWYPWHSSYVTQDYWKDQRNQKKYIEWLTDTLQIRSQADWYNVSRADFIKNGGRTLLQLYNGKLNKVLEANIPGSTFYEWLWEGGSMVQWDVSNCREFFDWLSVKLSMNTQEELYFITVDDMLRYGGELLLANNNYSVYSCIRMAYPEFTWFGWKFEWNSLTTAQMQRFFNQLSSKLNIVYQSDWYAVKMSDVRQEDGDISKFHETFIYGLEEVYPMFTWYPWLFPNVPHGYWSDHSNQRKYMEWLGDILGITSVDQWYDVKISQMKQNAGDGLLRHCSNSLKTIIKNSFHERRWNSWGFAKVEAGFWHNQSNLEEYVKWLAKKLCIQKPNDWYNTSWQQIKRLGGSYPLQHGLYQFIYTAYELMDQEQVVFQKKEQDALFRVLCQIFHFKDQS